MADGVIRIFPFEGGFVGPKAGSNFPGDPVTTPVVVVPTPVSSGPGLMSPLPARTVVNSDYTYSTAGGTLENLDIYGDLNINASNVIVKNCRVRGSTTRTTYRPLVVFGSGVINTRFENCHFEEDSPRPYNECAMWGTDFTLYHCRVKGMVDGVQIRGSNVTVDFCHISDMVYYASHPSQNGGATHNDGVQVLGGSNLNITNNLIENPLNFCVLFNGEYSLASGTVANNQFVGGSWMFKTNKHNNGVNLTLSNNVFTKATTTQAVIVVVTGTNVTMTNNTLSSGAAAPVVYTSS